MMCLSCRLYPRSWLHHSAVGQISIIGMQSVKLFKPYICTCIDIVNKVKRQLDTNYFKWSEHFLLLHKAMFMCITMFTKLSFKFRGSQGKVACGITANIIQCGNFDFLLSTWSRLCLQITYLRNKASTCTFPFYVDIHKVWCLSP